MATTWNFFSKLQETASVGNEDFLTSCLATLLAGIPELQQEFLGWLDPEVKIDLVSRAWEIYGQKSYASSEWGEARLDMVFVSGDVELWFEHKWGASEGVSASKTNPQETIRQLDKYQHTRRLQEDGRDAKVLLFYITADGQPLERARFEGQIHDSSERGGLVWNSRRNGSFRWADFFPRVRSVLSGLQSEGRPSGFRTQLLESFVTWWATREGLAVPPACEVLHPEDYRDREGLLQAACDWLVTNTKLGRGKVEISVRKGDDLYIWTGRTDIDRLSSKPYRAERIEGWNAVEDGNNVLKMDFRLRADRLRSCDLDKRHVLDDGRTVLVGLNERGEKRYLDMFIELPDWDSELTSEGRKRAIVAAVQCGFYLCRQLTGVDLNKASDVNAAATV